MSVINTLHNLMRLTLLATMLCSTLCVQSASATPAATDKSPSLPSILVLGDSLSAAYGIGAGDGWVALLRQHLQGLSGPDGQYSVVNASISGETSAGALSRLPGLLNTYRPAIVIIEVGANDGLRGHPVTTLRDNLQKLVSLSREAGARVLLVGMHIPPNYGSRYTRLFYDSFTQTAQQFDVPLVPFLLQDIATESGLMQEDGLHPTVQGQPQMLRNVLPYLEPLL